MVFLKKTDMKRAMGVWDDSAQYLPRQFMLDMLDEYGTAYWISGVLFWLCSCVEEPVDLFRFFRIQKKMRSLGYAIHEDIPEAYPIIKGQMGKDFNNYYKFQTDLRHARHISPDLGDWGNKERRTCRMAAKKFVRSGETNLTAFCRKAVFKKKHYRERQLLIAYYVANLGYSKASLGV